jgi:hypothetical protein
MTSFVLGFVLVKEKEKYFIRFVSFTQSTGTSWSHLTFPAVESRNRVQQIRRDWTTVAASTVSG